LRPVLRRARDGIFVSLLALAGCASTPEATSALDVEAKRFIAAPEASTIYVYRDDFAVEEMDTQDSTLYIDGRLIGATLPKTYFRFHVRAGAHLLHGYGYDQGTLKLETHIGEIYFVSLHVAGGTSRFTPVAPETGKRDILRCCTLLESWAPGQRPFLR
jgi:hypothetical protein